MFPKDCKFRTGMKEGNVWCFYCQIKIDTYFNSSSTFWFHKIWPNSTVTKTSKNFAKTVFSPSGPPRVFEFPESPIIAVCPISNDGDTVLKCRKLWTRDKKSIKKTYIYIKKQVLFDAQLTYCNGQELHFCNPWDKYNHCLVFYI